MSSIIILLIYTLCGTYGIKWYAKKFAKEVNVPFTKAFTISLSGYLVDFLILYLLAQWILRGADVMEIIKKLKKMYWAWGLCQLIIYPTVVVLLTQYLLKINLKKAMNYPEAEPSRYPILHYSNSRV